LQMSTPAKIDFFLMSKKHLIETSELFKNFFSDKQTSTGSPENWQNIIVLPLVFFERVKNSSATIWKAKSVDKSATGSGIFKIIFAFVIQYFGLNDTYFWLIIEQIRNRL